jgi:hypothetical protein
MTTLLVISSLLGVTLGIRYRALALVPAGAMILTVSVVAGIRGGIPHTMMLAILSAASLQLGYLAGATLNHLPLMLRKPDSWRGPISSAREPTR